jgi:hypothetical protein
VIVRVNWNGNSQEAQSKYRVVSELWITPMNTIMAGGVRRGSLGRCWHDKIKA